MTNRFSINETDPSSSPRHTMRADNSEPILILLEQQRDNFPMLRSFIRARSLSPSAMFLPQTHKLIDAELSSNVALVLDCLSYIDVVKLYSLVHTGNTQQFTDAVIELIVDNRTTAKPELLLAKDGIDDFTFVSKEDTIDFLNSNPLVLAIYLFSLIDLIFFEPTE